MIDPASVPNDSIKCIRIIIYKYYMISLLYLYNTLTDPDVVLLVSVNLKADSRLVAHQNPGGGEVRGAIRFSWTFGTSISPEKDTFVAQNVSFVGSVICSGVFVGCGSNFFSNSWFQTVGFHLHLAIY